MALTPDDITAIFHALNESDWDEAVVEVGEVRIAVSRSGPLGDGSTTGLTRPVVATPATAPSVPAGTVEPAAIPARATTAPAAPAPTDVPHAAPAAEFGPTAPGDIVVEAPTVGVFWRAPDPSADPFVEVGSHVEPGDTLGIVEVMKLMSNVAAAVSGKVTAILCENGQKVEHGTPLLTIRPDAG